MEKYIFLKQQQELYFFIVLSLMVFTYNHGDVSGK